MIMSVKLRRRHKAITEGNTEQHKRERTNEQMTRHLPRTYETGNCMNEPTRKCTEPNKNIQPTTIGKGTRRSINML